MMCCAVQGGSDGVHVPGLVRVQVSSPEHVATVIAQGQRRRATAATDMNAVRRRLFTVGVHV
jgi:hypothetical protein